MKRIEGLDLSREYCEKPFEAEKAYSRLNVSIVLYDNEEYDGFEVVRSHYVATGTHSPNECQVGETITDSEETYFEVDEAYDAFQVQCVKGFTQQVVWHNAQVEETKKAVK